jgi:hypothetical protein
VGALEVFTAALERIVREDGLEPPAIVRRAREPLARLIVVYEGIEEEAVHRRLDDGSAPGHARLERLAVQRRHPGSISVLDHRAVYA